VDQCGDTARILVRLWKYNGNTVLSVQEAQLLVNHVSEMRKQDSFRGRWIGERLGASS
jgi:hypothetical protein